MGCCSSAAASKKAKAAKASSAGKANKKKAKKGDKHCASFLDSPDDEISPLPPKSKSDSDVAPDFEEIHFICPKGCVVVMNKVNGHSHMWQCSRMDWSAEHIKILLFYGPEHPELTRKGTKTPFKSWVLVETTSVEKDPLVVQPNAKTEVTEKRPPIGSCWERSHVDGTFTQGWSLVYAAPEQEQMDPTDTYESDSCKVDFKCTANIAQVTIRMQKPAFTDETLEGLLNHFDNFLCDLAKRPDMTLFWVLDLTGGSVPTMKHVRRFIAWTDDLSIPLRLLVRGSVVMLDSSGFVGMALSSIVNMILKLKPAPWPLKVLPNEEESQAFIDNCMKRATSLAKKAKQAQGEQKEIRKVQSNSGSQLSNALSTALQEFDDKPVQIMELERPADNRRCQPCVCTLFEKPASDNAVHVAAGA